MGPPGSGGGRGSPPEVVVEEDLPPEVVVEEDPPEVVVEEDPPKARTRPDQLRSTAGQVEKRLSCSLWNHYTAVTFSTTLLRIGFEMWTTLGKNQQSEKDVLHYLCADCNLRLSL